MADFEECCVDASRKSSGIQEMEASKEAMVNRGNVEEDGRKAKSKTSMYGRGQEGIPTTENVIGHEYCGSII